MLIVETCPKCGYTLTSLCYPTYPPQYGKECFNCGWKSEVKKEKIVYQPYKDKSMSKDHWIDDADHYICPICGFITGSPTKYDGCKCPKCGFQDEKDRN